MKNERLASIFASYPFETRLQVSLMEAILGSDKVEKVLDSLDSKGVPSEVIIEGRPLRAYSGMTEEQLDQIGLSDEGKEQLYEYYEKPSKPKSESQEQPDEAPEARASSEASPVTKDSSPKSKEENK